MWDGLLNLTPNMTYIVNSTQASAAPFDEFIRSFNILGMGSEVIAIAISLFIAIGITKNEMTNKKEYTSTVAIFLMSYVSFFTVQYATNLGLLVLFSILGITQIVVAEGTKVFRS